MPRCRDEWTGREFKSSVAQIESAINRSNARIIAEGGITLNDFYDELGVLPVGAGANCGWEKPFEVRFSPAINEKGKLILEFFFHTYPEDVRAWTR